MNGSGLGTIPTAGLGLGDPLVVAVLFRTGSRGDTWTQYPPVETQKFVSRRTKVGGVKWLEVGVYARIGEYHLYHAWYLNEEGEIRPVLQSRGLSCKTDHQHHPYWRLDFGIAGDDRDQVFEYTDGTTNEGWGPGWHKYTNEVNAVKDPPKHRRWFVRDSQTSHGFVGIARRWLSPNTG